jgi:nucleotide-binding universal stress UspA family protein
MSEFSPRIALPIDLADDSEQVYAHAIKLALGARARLTLIHVREPGEGVSWARLPTVRELLMRWGVLPAGADLEEYGALDLEVRVQTPTDRDKVGGALETVSREAPDLLVVGTHRRQGLERLRRGSVAESLARGSGVSTLFVGEKTHGFVDPGTGELKLARVLVPVGPEMDPQGCFNEVAGLLSLLGVRGAHLVMLQVGGFANLEDINTDAFEGYTVVGVRVEGEVVDAIVDAAQAVDAQLIAMPTRGRDSLRDRLWGTRTEQVMRRAPCPLLSLPIRGSVFAQVAV